MDKKTQILKQVWDKWAVKEWFHYANYENPQSNKIIVVTKFNPILERGAFSVFMGQFPEIQYEFRNPNQQ